MTLGLSDIKCSLDSPEFRSLLSSERKQLSFRWAPNTPQPLVCFVTSSSRSLQPGCTAGVKNQGAHRWAFLLPLIEMYPKVVLKSSCHKLNPFIHIWAGRAS